MTFDTNILLAIERPLLFVFYYIIVKYGICQVKKRRINIYLVSVNCAVLQNYQKHSVYAALQVITIIWAHCRNPRECLRFEFYNTAQLINSVF